MKVKLWWAGAPERKKSAFFVPFILFTVSRLLCFISINSVLNTLWEYTHFYISKNITSYTFLIVFKIVESCQCILKNKYTFTSYQKTLFHIDYQPISINQNNIISNILYTYNKIEVTWTYFWYILWPNSLQPLNHLTPRIYDIVPSLSWLEKHLIFDQSCF